MSRTAPRNKPETEDVFNDSDLESVGASVTSTEGSDWEDAGQLITSGIDVDEEYFDRACLTESKMNLGEDQPEEEETQHVREMLQKMEEHLVEKDRASAEEIATLHSDLDQKNDELMLARRESSAHMARAEAAQSELDMLRTEHARVMRQQSLLKSLVDHWQAEASQKDAALAAMRADLSSRGDDYRSKVQQVEALLRAERRRREDLERLLQAERMTTERLERDLAGASDAQQQAVAMFHRLQDMNVFERLELAFCITINHPRAVRVLVGPEHAGLLLTTEVAREIKLLTHDKT